MLLFLATLPFIVKALAIGVISLFIVVVLYITEPARDNKPGQLTPEPEPKDKD